MIRKVFSALLFIFFTFSFLHAETAEPYSHDEFPEVLHDIRRAEIITLGAMPFITFNVTLGYSFGKYACHGFDYDYFVNPFSTTDNSAFSTDEQIGIILTSLGISAGIGITDFIVHTVKRSKQQKKLKKQKTDVHITPVQEDADAVKIEPPGEIHEEP